MDSASDALAATVDVMAVSYKGNENLSTTPQNLSVILSRVFLVL